MEIDFLNEFLKKKGFDENKQYGPEDLYVMAVGYKDMLWLEKQIKKYGEQQRQIGFNGAREKEVFKYEEHKMIDKYEEFEDFESAGSEAK